MEQAAVEARAIQRVREQKIRVYAVRNRPGVYWARSASEPAVRYTLVAKLGIEACSCRGYEYRNSCKHVEALRNRLAREEARAEQVEASYVPRARTAAELAEAAEALYG